MVLTFLHDPGAYPRQSSHLSVRSSFNITDVVRYLGIGDSDGRSAISVR